MNTAQMVRLLEMKNECQAKIDALTSVSNHIKTGLVSSIPELHTFVLSEIESINSDKFTINQALAMEDEEKDLTPT